MKYKNNLTQILLDECLIGRVKQPLLYAENIATEMQMLEKQLKTSRNISASMTTTIVTQTQICKGKVNV